MSRTKEELLLREPGKVSLYVCGVTPYDAMHIGHARAFTVYDVLRRFLQSRGYVVEHVQNVTDVDDKIINRAAEVGISASELAENFTREAADDLKALGILPAHHYPRVTGNIENIIDMVRGLEAKGYAYARGGDVYFDVSKDAAYGKLSGQKLDELEAGARIDPGEHKDDPLDFALWKAAKPGEPSWTSPWGPGRPGWHIECSAMALNILGAGFDIHGGARELMFPHHENEVAQSECFLEGEVFAKLWWHCGVVQVEGKKMSKSLGNFLTVRASLELAPPNVWRLLFLMTHPRSPLDYSEERLQQTRNTWARLHAALSGAESVPASAEGAAVARDFQERFQSALADDLNTPVALAAVFEAITEWHRTHSAELVAAVRHAMESLGFEFAPIELSNGTDELTPQLLQLLIEVRDIARERRDFPGADLIRNRLKELGVLLEDTVEGTRWKKAL